MRLVIAFILSCMAAFSQSVVRVDLTPVFVSTGSVPPSPYGPVQVVNSAGVKLYTDAGATALATTYTDATGTTACPSTVA